MGGWGRIELPTEGAAYARLEAYEDELFVERVHALELPAGVSRVRVGGLPTSFRLESARVTADPATVLSVDLASEPRPPPPPEGRQFELRGRVAGARSLIELLDALEPLAPTSPQALWKGAERFGALRRGASARLRDAEHALEAEAAAGPQPPSVSLDLVLRSPRPTSCRLVIHGSVGSSAHALLYRLDVEGDAVRLAAFAELEHPLGEVRVDGELKLLKGLPPSSFPPMSRRPWVVRSDQLFEDRSPQLYRDAARIPPATHEPQPPRSGSTSIRIPGPLGVGASPARLPLGEVAYGARVDYIARPALDRRAFCQLEIYPRPGTRLEAGDIRLVLGGLTRVRKKVPVATEAKPWRFELGPEPGIYTSRRSQTELRTEGLLQREDVHRASVKIELCNDLPHPVTVRVEDQIPVALDPRIRTRLLHLSPGKGQLDRETGTVSTQVQLGAQSKVVIEMSYEVDAPRDYRLVQSLGAVP